MNDETIDDFYRLDCFRPSTAAHRPSDTPSPFEPKLKRWAKCFDCKRPIYRYASLSLRCKDCHRACIKRHLRAKW